MGFLAALFLIVSASLWSAQPQRIVSLAPSVTETLFALKLGDRVVGVTDYCNYPPEAARLPKVGGYVTPNYEAVAALHPDLAVVLPEHEDVQRQLAALGIKTFRMDDRNLKSLLAGIQALGDQCGAHDEALKLTAELQGLLDRIARLTAGKPKPRVLLSIGHGGGADSFREIHASGPGSIHHELILAAGGENAVPSNMAPYPILSAEGLLRLNPDVILEFAPELKSPEELRREWNAFPSLAAVRENRVFVFNQDFLSIPGPRLVRFIETLARALHPEVPWDKN